MSEELVRQELTAKEVKTQVNLIQEVMTAVMKKDVHYGVIPGCKQPSLYKAGAEKILTTFRLSVEPIVEDLSTHDEIKYRVTARGVHQISGIFVGAGIGECSSSEDKYKWRGAVSPEEFAATPEDRKRIKYGKGYTTNQVRTNPADLANTVLKMAKKRAQVDLTLTATAASDCFTQDLEDIPDEYDNIKGPAAASGKPTTAAPQKKAEAPTGGAQEVTGLIEAITFKEGNSKGKVWTLYTIKAAGMTFSTFDKKHAEYAKEAKEMEQPVKIEYTAGEKGNTMVSVKVDMGNDVQPEEEEGQ